MKSNLLISTFALLASLSIFGDEHNKSEKEFESKAIAMPYLKSHVEAISKCSLYFFCIRKRNV